MNVTFFIPILPPSVNSCWRKKAGGGFYLTKQAQAFIDAVAMLAPQVVTTRGEFYYVDALFHIQAKEFLRFDLDNFSKLTCDSLKKSGVIVDDRYIIDLHLHKESVIGRENEGTTFTVLTK